jgi:hypothetical protein
MPRKISREKARARGLKKFFTGKPCCRGHLSERREGLALIREADNLACQSWNEKMWSDGGPIDPSPTIDQAINGG